jgi:hypothetical protein
MYSTVLVCFQTNVSALKDAVEFHAVALLETMPCVWPMTFLSGVQRNNTKKARELEILNPTQGVPVPRSTS